MITKLTDAQIARFPEFIKKWTEVGLSTQPADRLRAEHGIRLAYAAANLKAPTKIVWTTSPLAQALTRALVLHGKFDAGKSVRDSVRDSVWNSVRDSVWNSVKDSALDSALDSVWASVRDSVWDSVRISVWDSVWNSVKDSVRDSALDSAWNSVKDSVRDSALDSAWASVRDSVWASGYGQHDANWIGFYDFFRRACSLESQTDQLIGLTEVTESAGWYLLHEHICWIAERHRRVCRNGRGQLHSHDGMAVEYPDGWGVWAWNGVRVNEQIILRPETLSPEQIAKEQNAQVWQVMVDRIGIERVCQMFRSQTIDKHGTYELIILDLGDGRLRPYLKMLNPSIGVWHVEGVEPTVRTVRAALNRKRQ